MIRLYRALLRLYPASFREAYGDELCVVFEERLAREARAAARILLGVQAVLDVVPNALGAHAEILIQDLRFSVRTLARAPGFALTAVLVVAFGVGANTAAFSVADFVLLRPLPFPDPERLVRVWERTPGYGRLELSPANFRDWKEMTTSFAGMAGFNNTAMNLVGREEPRRVEAARVTRDLFEVLGVPPARGRAFQPDADTPGERNVVLSHGLWETELGGDPDVIGTTVELDGTPYEVIGIMPESFLFPSRYTRLWVPLEFGEEDFQDRNDNYVEVVARLAAGVGLDRARADLERAAVRLAEAHPESNAEIRSNAYLLSQDLPGRARLLLWALGGAALCILVLACANLTNLLIARGATRGRELAVRTALGAGRERLIRQMATESAVLALAGGIAGVALATAAVPLLAHLVPPTLPIADRPRLDLRVLSMAGLFTVVTGLGFGVLPAFQAGGSRGFGGLRDGGRGGSPRTRRVRATLVSVQVASSVVLLVGAGLLTRAIWRLHDVDPGIRTEGVLTLRTALPWPAYAPTERRHEFYERVIQDVRALPGVRGAAYTSGLPMVMRGGIWPVSTGEGEQVVRSASNTASLRFVTPGYFEVLDIPLLQGRDFRAQDGPDQPYVAVVSESFAQRYWPDQSPLGKRFDFGLAERTIVGVVRDVRVRGLEQESEPQVYLAHQQVPDGWLIYYAPKDLIVSGDVDPLALLPAVRRIVSAVDPRQPVSDARTMEDVVAAEAAPRRAQLRVLVALAATALLLAGVGIHGLLGYSVSLRSREIGVRMALGARRGEVARMVAREAMAMVIAGVVPGLLLALAAGRALSALLLGVRPADPAVLGVAVGATLLLAAAGALVPALRAVRVDPTRAMNAE